MSNLNSAGKIPVVKVNPYAQICGITIKTYEEFLAEVGSNEALLTGWNKLPEPGKQKIRRYYEGESLPPFTSDSIFKHLFNPDTHPERLSELLSLLIGISCKVKKTLSLDNIPLSLYSKKIIMDILVELDTGELANVEIQRVVADFSAKRAAVLSSSLITRQYSILKEQHKLDIDFEQIEKVYTIVFFEEDISECRNCPNKYIHKAKQVFDTGIQMDLMQEYIFVELNKFNHLVATIDTHLDAWLKLILTRTPTDIEDLLSRFSSFQDICSDAIMYLNDREVMLSMILEGLEEMDERSFTNMLKRREKQVAELQETVKQKDATLEQKDNALKQKDSVLKQKDNEIAALRKLLEKAGIHDMQ